MFRLIMDKILGKNMLYNESLYGDIELKKSLEVNINLFKKVFADDDTIEYRKISSKGSNPLKFCLVYVNGMVNNDALSRNIIKPLMKALARDLLLNNRTLDHISQRVIDIDNIKITASLHEIVSEVLSGKTLVLIEGFKKAFIVGTAQLEKRSIEEPPSEKVVRGPREGFTESIITNLALIRKKIKNSDLKFKFKVVGARTKTNVCICYIDTLVNKKILEEVYKRLDDIKIDGILDSGYVEELIKDSPLSPFSTVGNTERPDIVASRLLEGRIALVVDGTPFVLTIPHLFIEYFQSEGDYYNNFILGSINRMITFIGFFLATSVPAIYVALTTFHQEMIPTPLLLSISALREGVPFPTIVEAVFMLFAFEILREGGVRLPTPVGATISFIGALIIGQAAVQAKIFSAPIVIVVAITGITNFLTPKMIGGLIVVRFIFLILSAFLGLYGYIFGVIGLFIHLMSMRSFGVPYMMYIGSIKGQEIKDTVIRAPWWLMYLRPKIIGQQDSVRKQGFETSKGSK